MKILVPSFSTAGDAEPSVYTCVSSVYINTGFYKTNVLSLSKADDSCSLLSSGYNTNEYIFPIGSEVILTANDAMVDATRRKRQRKFKRRQNKISGNLDDDYITPIAGSELTDFLEPIKTHTTMFFPSFQRLAGVLPSDETRLMDV